ncbi:MAG: FG-GAP repeat domain-containing protein [Porticoccaceae bacterium]
MNIQQLAKKWVFGQAHLELYQVMTRGALQNMFVGKYATNESQGIAIWKKTNNAWAISSSFMLPISFRVGFISWQNTVGETNVIELDGEQYLSGSFDEVCVMRNYDDSQDYFIVGKFSTSKLPTEIDINATYKQSDAYSVQVMVFFKEIDGVLQRVESLIEGEITAVNSNFYDCSDVNGDSYSDLTNLVLSKWWELDIGGKPIIYLNNSEGKLVRIGTEDYPTFDSGHSQGNLFDINYDGLMDLVLFQQNIQKCCYTNDIRIYLANRNIGSYESPK